MSLLVVVDHTPPPHSMATVVRLISRMCFLNLITLFAANSIRNLWFGKRPFCHVLHQFQEVSLARFFSLSHWLAIFPFFFFFLFFISVHSHFYIHLSQCASRNLLWFTLLCFLDWIVLNGQASGLAKSGSNRNRDRERGRARKEAVSESNRGMFELNRWVLHNVEWDMEYGAMDYFCCI